MTEQIIPRITWAALLIIIFALYPVLNHRGENAKIIKLWIDELIPFIPIFSIPYLLYIPFLIITLCYLVFFTNLYQSASISFIFCLVIAYSIYFIYQTTVPRPEVSGTDILSQLVLYVYSKDQPYNCFPSLHTALSVLSLLYWVQVSPSLQLPVGAFVGSVILSTVFIKQHYITDALGGIILAILSFYIGQNLHL